MRFFVYMVQCSDKSYYTGYTNDVDKRVAKHNAGKGAKYTRSRLPVRLIWTETYTTKSDAMKRERQIKKMDRDSKRVMVTKMTETQEKLYIEQIRKILHKYRGMGSLRLVELVRKAFESI